MDPFPTLQDLLSALSLGAWTLLAVALGLLFYGYIVDRVIFDSGGRLHTEKLGSIDAIVAALLGTLLAVSVLDAIRSPAGVSEDTLPSASRMVLGVVSSSVILAVLVGGILGGLSARRIPWREVFGLDQQGPAAVVGYAVMSLALALPLITCVGLLSRLLLAANGSEDDSAQELVRFLGESPSRMARYAVACSAVVVAPVLEEFIFRGYLYGVARRYAGITAGIFFNAFLFAAIHTHLPSFGGLFALAVCLTLAYEWTGSIFVPITMHALFNLISVVQLLHGSASGAAIHGR